MIAQYWETVRHLRAEQVLARVKLRTAAMARRSWPTAAAAVYRRRVAQSGLRLRTGLLGPGAGIARAAMAPRDAQQTARISGIEAGRFEFLNDTANLGWPPDWSAAGKPRLWLFHLHYFDDALDLVRASRSTILLDLIEDWIRANPIGGVARDAWHPYTVSLRMVNWMIALSAMTDRSVSAPVSASLAEHAIFLARNLEQDGGGNHLLKNLKAITFAGCCFEGTIADGWRSRFGAAFARELQRQLLADGGHYERSPMYHCQVMGDAIEVATVLAPTHHESVPALLELIGRMDSFLARVMHPDGEVALFNDSAHGMAPSPAALHSATSPLGVIPSTACSPSVAAGSSGYVVLPEAQRSRFLIADVGAICPDDLPAHAHADLLSYELSLDGQRVLVNSGVGEYAAGARRDYYRSTRAHNTVALDGIEQSDCWSSFRVGRRASPVDVSYRRDGQLTILSAGHTGYGNVGVRHERAFVWSSAGFWIVADKAIGSGDHSWESYCHLHPDARVIASGDSWARIVRGGSVLDICWYGFRSARCVRAQDEPLQGWYAERFGSPVPATVVVLGGRGALPAKFGYVLVPREAADSSEARAALDPCGVSIQIDDRTYRIQIHA